MPTFFAGQTDYIEKLNDVDAAAGAAQDDIDAHIADTTAAHAASAISNTPAGNIAATTVQGAINELDSEKLSASATALPSSFASASLNSITPTGGVLAVTGSISATNSAAGAAVGAFQSSAVDGFTGIEYKDAAGTTKAYIGLEQNGISDGIRINAIGATGTLYQGSAAKLQWSSSGVSVTGLLDLSNAASGQVKFPATQNASADANTLDDHERGDWSATLASSGGGTVTLNGTAKYTKNGNAVCVYLETFNVDISSLSAGDLSITGLPFVCSAASPAIAYFDIAGAASAGQGSVVAYASNSATAQLLRSESTAATLTALTKADLNSNVSIRFNGSYRV